MRSSQVRFIGLLRHGETEGGGGFLGSTDRPLSAGGFRQMDKSAARRDWDRIITSPLRRCREFAESLASSLNAPLRVDGRLREIHFGVLEGRTATEILIREAATLTRFWRDPIRHTPPGGEPVLAFQARVLDAWSDIVEDVGSSILVISHGGPIRVILSHVRKRPLERLLELDVPHGSLHAIRLEREQDGYPWHAHWIGGEG